MQLRPKKHKSNHLSNPILAAIKVITLATALVFPPLSSAMNNGTGIDGEKYFELSLATIEQELTASHPGKSGAIVFEKGEEALLVRAWLSDHAVHKIDVQYFIWSSDNIGILAAETLLNAAERGVKIRVLVDDLLIDAPDKVMVALGQHPNIQIRIYNPKHSVGITLIERLFNIVAEFHAVNQRMHDKTFTVDERVSIVGGRNMADEYFDYNRSYNFRDRDILLLGPVVKDVNHNFEQFWDSSLAVPLEELLEIQASSITPVKRVAIYQDLHRYALDPKNFKPKVKQALFSFHQKFGDIGEMIIWDEIIFTHDMPGKNESGTMSGGGNSTDTLIKALQGAQQSVLIQSPYLVMPKGGIDIFKQLIKRGVKVQISTNSLASTDNLQAFSGYAKQRQVIIDAGIEVFEYKPNPAIQRNLIERYEEVEKEVPTFAIHAKTMVIDHDLIFIGTFNLDPRSAHLNTEVGALIRNTALASQVEEAINRDILPENSWNAATDDPDRNASWGKRLKVLFWKLLPLNPLL